MSAEKTISLSSLDDLSNAASTFLQTYPNDHIFAFYGDMGVGKTTFIKELCKQLGVEDEASSPTFSIVNEYGDKPLIFHIDAYRIEDEKEMMDIGVHEYFEQGDYCFIEWPSKIESVLPEETIRIEMQQANEARTITLKN